MLFLHALHGSSAAGGCCPFMFLSESRYVFFGAGMAGRSSVRSIFFTRPLLSAINSAMSEASGRFFQYVFVILRGVGEDFEFVLQVHIVA